MHKMTEHIHARDALLEVTSIEFQIQAESSECYRLMVRSIGELRSGQLVIQ